MFNWENEREDIQLAHEQNVSQARENQYKDQMRSFDVSFPEYGEQETSMAISLIVEHMIKTNSARALFFKDQIHWDVEDIHEAVEACCIKEGLSTEVFSPYINDKGEQVEIYL